LAPRLLSVLPWQQPLALQREPELRPASQQPKGLLPATVLRRVLEPQRRLAHRLSQLLALPLVWEALRPYPAAERRTTDETIKAAVKGSSEAGELLRKRS
jgi:hypothetical protein